VKGTYPTIAISATKKKKKKKQINKYMNIQGMELTQ
jgi:hypothetical protein